VIRELGIFERDSFRYHRDLYLGHASYGRLHAPTMTFQRAGGTVAYLADDPQNPVCPGLPNDPLCQANALTAYGLDFRYALGRRLVFEGEWLRTGFIADRREASAERAWANGFRLTGQLDIVPRHLRLDSAYLSLDEAFESPYSAVTYRPNRKGQRHRIVGTARGVRLDLFMRWLEPVAREWVDVTERSTITEEQVSSVQASVVARSVWEARAGYQHELQRLEVDPDAGDAYRDPRRDITVVSAGYHGKHIEVYFDQQWIWEESPRRALENGHAVIMSLTARARF